ncbi:MAG: tetratricopeptide repeat protein [Pseudomonadota bacterium]
MIRRHVCIVAAGLLSLMATVAVAWESEVADLEQRWERITTERPEGERREAFERLAEEAAALAEAHPDTAEPQVWYGIIEASHARERSGLGALDSAKKARAALEKAVELDADGNDGSAYVTLGALYDRAPGWPLGFGDEETAESMFEKALAIRPEGIDVNYYYAAFLAEEGRTEEAREHAERAMAGEVREGREGSDAALREQARELLSDL